MVPQQVGKVVMRLRHWEPVGSRVTIAFDSSDDSLISGEYVGTIESKTDRAIGASPHRQLASLLIKLDEEIDIDGVKVIRLVCRPRLQGHEYPRLLIADCETRFYANARKENPDPKESEKLLAVGVLSLAN